MCVYRKDDPIHFKMAVESVCNQTLVPNEIVIVVDGPVPKALDIIISKYEKIELFKVIRLPQNVGHGIARKIGLEYCKNKLVALMDADDLCVPNRFFMQICAFEKDSKLSIVGGQIAEFIDDPTNPISFRRVPLLNNEIQNYIRVRCPMNQVTVMFKKEDVLKVGGFQDWYCEEDYYLWIRMSMAKMKFINLNDVLVNVRVGKKMYQRRGGWKYFMSEARLQKYMHDHHIISMKILSINIFKRLIVQVLLPNRIRGWVFKKFARKAF